VDHGSNSPTNDYLLFHNVQLACASASLNVNTWFGLRLMSMISAFISSMAHVDLLLNVYHSFISGMRWRRIQVFLVAHHRSKLTIVAELQNLFSPLHYSKDVVRQMSKLLLQDSPKNDVLEPLLTAFLLLTVFLET